jgi:multidrug transporter EmrE-like cation transporter
LLLTSLPLLAATALEVATTSALQASQQFSRPWLMALMVLG